MITLENTNTLETSGASGQVIVTVEGMEKNIITGAESYKVLAQAVATVGAVGSAIYTATGVTAFIKSIFIVSNSASIENIVFYIGGHAVTNEIYNLTLPIGGSAFFGQNGWNVYNSSGYLQYGVNNVRLFNIGGNTTGVTANISNGTFFIAGGNNITVSQNFNTFTISQHDQDLTYYDNAGTASGSAANLVSYHSLAFYPILAQQFFPAPITVNSWLFDMSGSVTTAGGNSIQDTCSLLFRVGIYTISDGTKLNLLNSASKMLFSSSSTYTAQSQLSSYFHGRRWIELTSGNWSDQCSLTPGRYYVATQLAASSGGATQNGLANLTMSAIGQNWWGSAIARSGFVGSLSVTNNTSKGVHPFLGILSFSTNGIPQTVALADINKQSAAGNFIPHMIFNNMTSQF